MDMMSNTSEAQADLESRPASIPEQPKAEQPGAGEHHAAGDLGPVEEHGPRTKRGRRAAKVAGGTSTAGVAEDRPAAAPMRAAVAQAGSKTVAVLKLLRRAKGASLAELTAATGWQAHSVRGHLSGVVRGKLGLVLMSETGRDGVRRYRIIAADVDAR